PHPSTSPPFPTRRSSDLYERHARLARATQAGLLALGFQLYARDGYRSNTVTSALPPAGLDVNALRKLLNDKYSVVIAGGQAKMADRKSTRLNSSHQINSY